jgi:Polyketide cyclase / dehydrase and lipid transport
MEPPSAATAVAYRQDSPMRLTLRADGTADIATVWQRYSEPQRWTSWAPQIRRVECSSDILDVGVTGTVFGVVPGIGAAFEVVEYDQSEHRWAWDVAAGPVRMHLDHRSESRIGGGTSTVLVVDGPSAVVLVYAPIARISLESLVRPPKS